MRGIIFATLAVLAATPAFGAPGLQGKWTNPSRSITVRIGPCGPSACGRVIAASAKARADAAEAGTDPLVGAELISGIEQAGSGRWRADIFVPDQNIRATGDITLTGPNSMSVRGCVAGGLICKEQLWTRAAPEKQRRRQGSHR